MDGRQDSHWTGPGWELTLSPLFITTHSRQSGEMIGSWDPTVFPNSRREAWLPGLLLQVRKWRSERLSDLPVVTQLVRAAPGFELRLA